MIFSGLLESARKSIFLNENELSPETHNMHKGNLDDSGFQVNDG